MPSIIVVPQTISNRFPFLKHFIIISHIQGKALLSGAMSTEIGFASTCRIEEMIGRERGKCYKRKKRREGRSVFSTFPIWKILENTLMFYKRKFWETIKSNFPNFSYILENSLFHFSQKNMQFEHVFYISSFLRKIFQKIGLIFCY